MAALAAGTTLDYGLLETHNAAIGDNPYAGYFDDRITRAFESASDLSKYTAAEIAAADGWVLNLNDPNAIDNVRSQLGTSNVVVTPYIVDTYIYTIPEGVDRAALGAQLQSLGGVEYAYPLVPRQKTKDFVPNDPYYNQQWHLNNTGQSGGTTNEDPNLEAAWDIARGTGVVIGIVDDGLQYTHPDLAGHYMAGLSIDINDGDADPAPDPFNDDTHGTAVAGVASASTNNGVGTSGAAPDARLAGIRFLAGPTTDADDAQAILHQNQSIDIYNNSWGLNDYGGPGPLAEAALQQAVIAGRSNLGSIIVFSGGNENLNGGDGNYDEYKNSWFVNAIAAIDHNGRQSSYSSPGANLLVAAPSSGGRGEVLTTDLSGTDGYNYDPSDFDDDAFADMNYTGTFGGTSSAAPLASGIIALMLQANPNLTWRDVQHILVRTARQNDPGDLGWSTNGAGLHVNHKYGFGAIDALAAVNMAATWTNVAAPQLYTGTLAVNAAIPDDANNGYVITFTVGNDIELEQIELVMNLTHDLPETLHISIESPDGTESILNRDHFTFAPTSNVLQDWSFRSKRHWGELVKGLWTIDISDKQPFDSGFINSIDFNFIGTPTTRQPVIGSISGYIGSDNNANGIFDTGDGFIETGTKVFLDTNNNGTPDAGEPQKMSLSTGHFTFAGLNPGTYTVDLVPKPLHTQTFPTAPPTYSVTVAANTLVAGADFLLAPPPIGIGPYYLNNGPGEGSVNVGVDGYGAFGSAVGFDADEAIYDPIGADVAAGTTFESGVAVGFDLGARTFLSSGINDTVTLDNPLVTGSNTTGASDFVLNDILLFHLDQALVPLNNAAGVRIGSELRQVYTITNIGTAPLTFDMVRYFDGDLDFDGSLIDGGGRILQNGNEILFETDTALGTSNATTFIGITASGGTIPTVGRYEVDHYRDLLEGIMDGIPFDQIITNDGPDPDQFVDLNQGYDVTLGLQNIYTLAPGAVGLYTTTTLFGTGSPEEVVNPTPPEPPPPPPVVIGGSVTVDVNGDGVADPGEPPLTNAIVYLDLNNDGQLSIGEPAQVTDGNGQYQFQVPDGTYIVRQAPVAGWEQVDPSAAFTVTGVSGDVITNTPFFNSARTDYGDAPAPFPTLLAQNGPSHGFVAGLFLGGNVDGEPDGQPSPSAAGDDQAFDDENGITFVTPLIPGQTAVIDVAVGPAAAGMLHAWVDFNRDGDWSDAGERIFSNQHVLPGTVNQLSFVVPASAIPGATFARFRYGYGNAVSFTGPMLGGEVEDYRVTLQRIDPTAVADSFTVNKNSTVNRFDVLANDVAGTRGAFTLQTFQATGSQGGHITRNPDSSLNYVPATNFLGNETFSYTISDSLGVLSSATVTVRVTEPGPVAIDDVFSAGVNTVNNFFGVTTNDLQPAGAITAIEIAQTTSKGGYVAINEGSLSLRYAPPFNFTGVDQFTYAIRDAQGLTSTATVTVYVGNTTADDVAGIELSFTDTLGAPITQATVGQEFQLHVSLRDKRTTPVDPGVLQAYVDVLYNTLVSVKSAANGFGFDVAFAAPFTQLRSGSAPNSGLIDELGAGRLTPPANTNPELLATITFIAAAPGTANFTADPADLATHAVQMGSPAVNVAIDKITYGAKSLSIVPAPGGAGEEGPPRTNDLNFRNVGDTYDVNGDKHVTPLDAIIIVNELNASGVSSLVGRVRNAFLPHFFDVSGDNFLSPIDALLVINRLNVGGFAEGEAAEEIVVSESVESAASAPALLPPELDLGEVADNEAVLAPSGALVVGELPVDFAPLAPAISSDSYDAIFGSSDDEDARDLLDLFEEI